MKRIYLVLAFALFATGGCKDNNKETLDFQKPFIGQWQEFARGNEMYPILPSSGRIIEFLPDGTYRQKEWTAEYRANAEFLYYNSGRYPDGHIFRYAFTGADILRLDHIYGVRTSLPTTPTFNIYERIK
jgi:hypothetical protein